MPRSTGAAQPETHGGRLEEEEQSLDRLRCSHREIKTRHVFGAPGAAEQLLKHCVQRLEQYTEQAFQALRHMYSGPLRTPRRGATMPSAAPADAVMSWP